MTGPGSGPELSTCHYLRVDECVYLADAGCYARVMVGASLHAAVAALAGRVAHITHSTPAHK